jgi:hypothetical protein
VKSPAPNISPMATAVTVARPVKDMHGSIAGSWPFGQRAS